MQITASALVTLFLTTGGCSTIHAPLDADINLGIVPQTSRVTRHYPDYIVLLADSPYKLHYREEVLADIRSRFGRQASTRVKSWYDFIDHNRNKTERDKISLVNTFFTDFEWIDDNTNWQDANYWENPIEFLLAGGGACEDFALAKYFTLIEMGVSTEKLRLSVVHVVRQRDAHMVLEYLAAPQDEPLILDNLTREVLPASDRKDLSPVYCLWHAVGNEISTTSWDHHAFETWPINRRKLTM